MESTFWFYATLGWQHIMDWAALDHLLFLLVLSVGFRLHQWRPLLVLVTAFTIGHALTLAAAGLGWLSVSAYWVELAIPLTIAFTALMRWWKPVAQLTTSVYVSTLVFGLIHGLGFANTFQSMLFPGEESQLIRQLLGFNLGVEGAQLLVLLIFVLVNEIWHALTSATKLSLSKWWSRIILAITFLAAIYMTWERI